MKLTKLDKAKVVITALYNLDKLVTEDNTILWKKVKRQCKLNMETLDSLYELSIKILEDKVKSQ